MTKLSPLTHPFARDFAVALRHDDEPTCTCGRLESNARHAELQPLTAEQRAHDNARLGEREDPDDQDR